MTRTSKPGNGFPYGRVTHHLMAAREELDGHEPRSEQEQRHHSRLVLSLAALIAAVRWVHHRVRWWRDDD